MIGRTISHYRIVSQLAAGGMGVVYRAEDIRLGREVAVKFVSEDFAHDPEAMERLRAEARASSALNHGNICTIHDIGEVDGHPFIVMELMKGQSLRDRLATGPLKIHQIVDLGIEIADGLQAAHAEGIIHRDIKPANIFVTDRGHVKILDFGLAKLMPKAEGDTTIAETLRRTQPGITLGTVSYMSPEQATGEDLDARTDIFSLGVVLYECATGQHPFPGRTSAVTFAAILTKAPVAPVALNVEVPPRLQEVINNCLEKDRELRYQSAADLRADLRRVRRDIESGHSRAMDVASVSTAAAARPAESADRSAAVQPAITAAVASGPAPARTNRSRTMAIAGAIAIVLLLGGGAAWFMTSRGTTSSSQRQAGDVSAASSAIEGRLALARASLQSGNYRAAAGYAAEILSLDPAHAEAQKIRDDTRAMFQRFDAAIDAARRELAAGDVQAAGRSLDTARAIDPGAPGLATLTAQLAAVAPRREPLPPQPERAEARRPAPVPPRSPAPPAEPAGRAVQQPPAPPPPPASPPPERAQAPAAPPVAPPPTAATPPPQPAAPVATPANEPAPAPRAAAPSPPAAERPAAANGAAERDEAALRRLVATYARAIETKNIGLFRTIKPNLSAEEERRLQQGFRAVTSQQVEMTVTAIMRNGDEATVAVRRRDTIQAGGRQQSSESRQTIAMARQGDNWVIVDIR